MIRKRAPGGGRKPKGAAPMRSQVNVRMPDDLRIELDAAAKRRRNGNLSDEIIGRLQRSLSREREERRDPAMRGLCHLIAELAHHVVGIHGMRGISRYEIWDWRSDAFFYRAFKLAVVRLLDALEPAGPIRPPEIVVNKGEPDSFTKRYIDSFEAPETRAEDAVEFILDALQKVPRMTEEELRELEVARPSVAYPFYGIARAASDLVVKPQGDTVPVTFNLGLSLTGETTSVTVRMPQSSFEQLEKLEGLKRGN
jgi:hypothetical protein